jgi:hypothetical protein
MPLILSGKNTEIRTEQRDQEKDEQEEQYCPEGPHPNGVYNDIPFEFWMQGMGD